MLKKLWNWINKNEGLVLLLLLAIVLRIPSLFEPCWYGDEGIYLVLGQAFKKGLVFYKDIHDNKPPLLYILAGLTGTVFSFRLLLMIWFEATIVVFYKLMQKFLPKNRIAWHISTLTMIILTTLCEGNIANAEIFIVLPVVSGVLLAFKQLESPKLKIEKWFYAGLMFSMGFLLKIPALFDFLALIIWFILFVENKENTIRFNLKYLRLNLVQKSIFQKLKSKKLWLAIFGFSLPIGASLVYYNIMGAGERYLRSALLQNIGYLASWETGAHSASGFSSQSGLLMRAGVFGILCLIFWCFAKKYKLSSKVSFVIIWFLLALFGALLSERPYPHYLIQPIIPASILLSFVLFKKRKLLKLISLSLIIITGFYYYRVSFWHYPLLPYYKNFIQYIVKDKNLEEYRSYFDWRVNQTYEIAKYIKDRTKADEKIFIWGDEPFIYSLSNRLPINKYVVAYHIVDFNGYDETMEAWDKYSPNFVIVMKYEKRDFNEMKARLLIEYVKIKTIDQALIYKRIDHNF